MNFARIFLISHLAILFFSCEADSKEIDPLFYQMSSEDSLKYSKELHDVLKLEMLDYENEQLKISNSGMCNDVPPYRDCDILSIELTNIGTHIVEGKRDTNSLSSVVFDFFIKNRNRTDNFFLISDTEVLRFPLYNKLTINSLKSSFWDKKQQLTEIENNEFADPLLIEYCRGLLSVAKERYELLKIFKADSLAFIPEMSFIEIENRDSESAYNEALDEVIDGYSHLRNYECLRYFGESYLSLFARAQKRQRQMDLDKLAGLKLFRPIRIKDLA